LVELLDSTNQAVRGVAATALQKIGGPGATDALIPYYVGAMQSSDPDTRAEVTSDLGRVEDARAVRPLCRALFDCSPSVREAAAVSIANLDGTNRQRAVELVKITLRDRNSVSRSVAREVLGRLQLKPTNTDERIDYAIVEGRFEDALAEGAVGLQEVFRVANQGDEQFHRDATEAIRKLEDQVSTASILAAADAHTLDRPDFLGIVMKFTLALIKKYSGLPTVLSQSAFPGTLDALTGAQVAMKGVIRQLKNDGLIEGIGFEAALCDYNYSNLPALLYGIAVLVAVVTPPITIREAEGLKSKPVYTLLINEYGYPIGSILDKVGLLPYANEPTKWRGLAERKLNVISLDYFRDMQSQGCFDGGNVQVIPSDAHANTIIEVMRLEGPRVDRD
jgi:hypothetical protein